MNNCTVQLFIDAELSYFLKKQNKLKLFKQYSILRMRKVNIYFVLRLDLSGRFHIRFSDLGYSPLI